MGKNKAENEEIKREKSEFLTGKDRVQEGDEENGCSCEVKDDGASQGEEM